MLGRIGANGGQDRVLVAVDDAYTRETLATAMGCAGFVTARTGTAAEALRQLDDFQPRLAVLDALLPDLDGYALARRIRQHGRQLPVLYLATPDTSPETLAGLQRGGDDYVTRPFSVAELIARMHTMLYRATHEISVLCYADLHLDEQGHHVRRAGQLVELSPTEYRLLRYLMLNAGRVVSKAQILDGVWQYQFVGGTSVVEKFISTLRRKIDFVDPPLVQTVRGFGYVLRTPIA
ncbi:MAG: response regulator transcription factor [Micromonosporaceae bacterium]|nr:response regulator transcription factor [Micromonosporaceae bacterium]